MTDIIFSFDTEDFTSDYAANAIYEEAEILRREGVKGGFCLVGLLAKQLKDWGRDDITEALSHHIIGNHSYGHTLHPTINEYTDLEDFDEAQSELLRQERESVRLINEVTDSKPIVFSCPPGNQKSYVAMYSYADMGCPIYADTVCDTPEGDGVFYCNIYQVRYTYMLESSFKALNSDEGIKNILDSLAEKKRAIIYTHPHYALVSECWDSVNYKKVNCEFGKWKECKRRDPEVTTSFYKGIERLIKAIKADGRFRITNYNELADELSAEGVRKVKMEDMGLIMNMLKKKFFPLKIPCSLSISDIFLACRKFLLGESEHICGKVYGFLTQPIGITKETVVHKRDMIESARTMDVSRFLPSEIKVGDALIGPADWLRAAMEIIATGCECVNIKPDVQLPSLDIIPSLRDCNFREYRWMQSDEFEDRYLSDRLKWQSWTMRFLKKD